MTRRRRMAPETRHRVMASIRKENSKPELALRSGLWAAGIRGWRCYQRLPGTPDVTFPRWKLALFVDGVWWHGHPKFLPRGRRGPYWDNKIAGNRARDKRVNRLLRKLGWTVLRMWDLDILSDPSTATRSVREILKQLGWRAPPQANRRDYQRTPRCLVSARSNG